MNRISNAKLMFDQFDGDKDGKISTDELRECLIEYGAHATEKSIELMVRILNFA